MVRFQFSTTTRRIYSLTNPLIIVTLLLLVSSGFSIEHREGIGKQLSKSDSLLIQTLPKSGKLVKGKPVGKNWIDLLTSLDEWNVEKNYWELKKHILHGDYQGGKFHNYIWTKKRYTDFELQVLIKLDGKDANSGVCIRLNPVDADNAPGYQIDMGEGYWGSLWEEKRAGMVQQFPVELAAKLVRMHDWNHYYIIAKGHHIQAWLNGVKTIDFVHESGFEEGSLGFQLCHGEKHTIVDVKSLYIKEIK
ncbi:MAG: DUF1080 domain-containing protein [Saprospiraceae bacterium]